MSETRIVSALRSQFDQSFSMLRELVSSFEGNTWTSGKPPNLVPARLTYHIVETTDFYVSDSPRAFQWGQLGGGWEELAPEELPAPSRILAYLDEAEARVAAWLANHGDEGLSETDREFEWFPSRLDRAVYSLRHQQNHIGELNGELKRQGLKPVEWR